MASITRREVADSIHRKMDDLGGGLKATELGSGQTEGDYTDGINSALRLCGFDTIASANTGDKIQAVLIATEYYMTQRLLNKWISRPTTQQGAGASGLHLMVQTESTISSLRQNVKHIREDLKNALAKIGVSLDRSSAILAGVAEIDHEDDASGPLVYGAHSLPWYEESYWPTT